MNAQGFERRMSALLSDLKAEAMQALQADAKGLEEMSVCSQKDFFTEMYVEFDLVKQRYGQEIARQLFSFAEKGSLYSSDLQAAAKLLRDGVDSDKIMQMVSEGLCKPSEQERHETTVAYNAFLDSEFIVKAVIHKDNGNMPDEYAGIALPITHRELHAVLKGLNFKPEDIDRCTIKGIEPKNINTEISEYFPKELHLTSIDTLNYLATEIEKLSGDDFQQQKFAVVLDWLDSADRDSFEQFTYPFDSDNIEDVINTILNLDKFTFIPSIDDYEALGRHIVSTEIENGSRLPISNDDDFDYDEYGYHIANYGDGELLDGYYVAGGHNFIPYMELDNAIPESSRVWYDSVVSFLPEEQKHKGYEYFRPEIDYSGLINGGTGVATIDLAAQIEEFCRTAHASGYSYDGSDNKQRGRTIIEFADLCEKRDKTIIDMLEKVAEDLAVVPDEQKDGDYTAIVRMKAAFYNLDNELESQVQDEWECGINSGDERLISGIIAEYPESLRNNPGFLALLVNREIHILEVAALSESNGNEPTSDIRMFQILPSDMQVQLELEHDLCHQLTQVKLAHENKIIKLYDKEIRDYQEESRQHGLQPQTKATREQLHRKQSVTAHLRELSDKIRNTPPSHNHKKTETEL